MDRICCGIKAAVRDGRMMYRGVVMCENRCTWHGKWTDSKLQAMRDADRMAEQIFDLNHNVLTVKRP